MSKEASAAATPPPGPSDQIAGLSFALLLVTPELRIAEVNPAGEVLLGASAARLSGRELLDVLGLTQSDLAERLKDPEAQLVARGLDVTINERPWRTNLTVSTMASHPGWRMITLSDASQGERFEEQERRPVLRGPAVLAHEIKNPLAAIRGAAQLLEKQASDKQAPLTRLVVQEVDRIAQLIDRMQRLGREQSEPVAPVNLHEAIRKAISTVKMTADDAVAWKEEFDPSLPPVLANDGALVQVLVNLIANARDAASQNVAPQIRIRTRFAGGVVTNVIRLGRSIKLPIEIRVSDNGSGVDPALRDHIFEPFVSSKAHGQGLGLALVQKLVRDMNGRVSHERDDAAGWTHFRIQLPVAKPNGEKT
ncbi:two-component system sensor histidine kinase NtrB [Aurantiacibacter sediminis]|uniref:histidine kinase n=1 Tax=Aurantiacibacter sediminis TaxID=2793064 RepID=A0ABS0N3P1_9SPHN|nr:ATP-binding protein [Aurantiacibacter sediminis]MBH5322590.1 PAS domain-containing sensor histidine kinase [Aurantiacibacter sediminis]